VNLDELERDMIRAAQRELAPSSADRERHQATLLARLGGGGLSGGGLAGGSFSSGSFSSGSAGSALGAVGRLPGSGGTLSRAVSSLRSSRFGMLGVGLIVGAMVGGWVGFGLGSRGSAVLAQPDPRVRAVPRASSDATSGAGARGLGALEGTAPTAATQPLGGAERLDAAVAPSEGTSTLQGETLGEPEPGAEGERRSASNAARGRGAAGGRSVASAPPTSSLAAELAMLQRARRALNARNGRLALGIVQDLDEQFPKGVLIEERSATRVLSLCQLERVDEARGVARAFLERYPVSVYAERVRRSCVAAPE
jgi:hypothetical protein